VSDSKTVGVAQIDSNDIALLQVALSVFKEGSINELKAANDGVIEIDADDMQMMKSGVAHATVLLGKLEMLMQSKIAEMGKH